MNAIVLLVSVLLATAVVASAASCTPISPVLIARVAITVIASTSTTPEIAAVAMKPARARYRLPFRLVHCEASRCEAKMGTVLTSCVGL